MVRPGVHRRGFLQGLDVLVHHPRGDVLHLHIPDDGVDVVGNQRVLAVVHGHTPPFFTIEGDEVRQELRNILIGGRKKGVGAFLALDLCLALQCLLIGSAGFPLLFGLAVLVHMSGVGGCQPSAGQTFLDALTHHFLKQPAENLAERKLATAQLRDGAVVRYPVKQLQTQIPPQGHIRLNPLLDLPFRWDSVQVSYHQILHQHHWGDGRAAIPGAVQIGCFFTHEGQVQRGFQFSQKVSLRDQIFYRHHVQLQLHSHPPLRSFFIISYFQ